MLESSVTGVVKDLCQICQGGVLVIAAYQIGVLDLVVLLVTPGWKEGNVESDEIHTSRMMAKSATWETGNVAAHCRRFLNKSARQAQERVAVQEQMMVHEAMVSETESHHPRPGAKDGLRDLKMAPGLRDETFRSDQYLSELLRLLNKIISGARR